MSYKLPKSHQLKRKTTLRYWSPGDESDELSFDSMEDLQSHRRRSSADSTAAGSGDVIIETGAPLSEAQIEAILAVADANADGWITYEEFLDAALNAADHDEEKNGADRAGRKSVDGALAGGNDDQGKQRCRRQKIPRAFIKQVTPKWYHNHYTAGKCVLCCCLFFVCLFVCLFICLFVPFPLFLFWRGRRDNWRNWLLGSCASKPKLRFPLSPDL